MMIRTHGKPFAPIGLVKGPGAPTPASVLALPGDLFAPQDAPHVLSRTAIENAIETLISLLDAADAPFEDLEDSHDTEAGHDAEPDVDDESDNDAEFNEPIRPEYCGPIFDVTPAGRAYLTSYRSDAR